MLDIRGIAVLTAIGVMATVGAVGAVGTPVAVDSFADQQPDEALYGLELAGEALKEPVMGGEEWNIERANERIDEYTNMAEEGKGPQYENVLQSGQKRIMESVQKAEDEEGLERARNRVQGHVQTLERVREIVPENAKGAIDRAIEKSSQVDNVLEDVSAPVEQGDLDRVREIAENSKRIGPPEGTPPA